MKRCITGLLMVMAACVVVGMTGFAGQSAQASERPDYRCLFNHELLIVCQKNMTSESIGAFVTKLTATDVNAVMCCPTMWRTNLFPSAVDPGWKSYDPEKGPSTFPRYDYAMAYLRSGGDPVQDTQDACKEAGKAFFISYRMNDHHYVTDLSWPTHNFVWREHPEYWLGDTETSPYVRDNDQVRLFNYMLPEVREYYFAILKELCANYDVDGVELDFQRFPRFFHNDEVEAGTQVMTAFVKRVRTMLDRLEGERGKPLQLCVRVPETPEKCRNAGLDVFAWDALGLVDMVNVSSFYIHTMELDIEGFAKGMNRARIYGEMNYVTYQNKDKRRRYTTFQVYRASALSLFSRGADGVSLFNYDYVPAPYRPTMTEGLKGITDSSFLRTSEKDYAVYPGFGTFRATNEREVEVFIPDDTVGGVFKRALVRVETQEPCDEIEIGVWLNGKRLQSIEHEDTELFPPLERNAAYAKHDALKFYEAPLDLFVQGLNKVAIKNLDSEKASCRLFSMEIALYR